MRQVHSRRSPMRWLTCVVFLFTILFAVSNSLAQQTSGSAVPNLIRFSGMLKHTNGQLLPSKIEGVTFAIYKQQDGGAPIWIETQNVTTDAAGNYSVLLGSTKACLLYTSPSPRDGLLSRMPSSA